MIKKRRIMSLFLVILILLTNTGPVLADMTLPDSNPIGPGNYGPYYAGAVFVKADFYKPSEYNFNRDNYKESKVVPVDNKGEIGPFNHLADRVMFYKGTRTPSMQNIDPSYGGNDSYDISQMYAYKGFGIKPFSFLVEKDRYTVKGIGGHKYVSANTMEGVNSNLYTNPNGLISVNSVLMKELLKVTNNGMEWDGDKIAKTLNQLWSDYVDPNGTKGFSSSSPMVLYRKEFASMFNNSQGDSTLDGAMIHINNVFKEQLKEGNTPPGANFKVVDAEHSSKLQNLMTATLALVLANPAGGVKVNGSVVSPSETFKGGTILKGLENWSRSGGNSNDSDNHFAIRLEMYASRGLQRGQDQFDRWDMAMYNATTGGDRYFFSVPARGYLDQTDKLYYGFDGDYTPSLAKEYFTLHTQSIVDTHTKWYSKPPMKDPRDSKANNYNYTSMFSIFQNVIINRQGKVAPAKSNYNYRGLLEYKTPGYYRGNNTVHLGFGHIAPSGFAGTPKETKKPNFLMDSTVFTEEQSIPEGSKATATSFTGFRFMPKPDEAIVKQYGLKIPDGTWRPSNEELYNLLKLIDRSKNSSQIASGAENKNLPVTLTIKRSIVNGKGNTDGKMIDDPWSALTEIQKCGQHNFKIVDNGNTATVTFNIIPSSGQCSYKEFKVVSPLLLADNKTGLESMASINNCAVATLFENASSRIKFNDTNIDITDTPGGTTTVNYDYSYTVKTPVFKENKQAYGDSKTDTMMKQANYTGLGYVVLPEKGATYPNSDWNSGFVRSNVIRRSVSFTRAPKGPYYTNLGHEKKHPHYSEIKQGGPTHEEFEAMSGTPTTRDLYMSVSGTDFKVDFNANPEAKRNPNTYRKYTYTVNVDNCWENNIKCTTMCPGHNYGFHGKHGSGEDEEPCTHWEYPPGASCGMGNTPACDWYTGSGCECSNTINQSHPDSHTWTYNINIPIEAFTYFDMEDSEVWRMIEWGLKGGEKYLAKPNPSWKMGTQFWGFNERDYSSKNGRLMFSEAMNSNDDGDLEKFGDNSREFTVSDNLRSVLKDEALSLVNGAKSGESSFTGSIISDYIVLKTSEGYQVPYFKEQPFDTTVSPSGAPDFTGEGGTVTTPDKLKVNKVLDINDLWWKNSNKEHTASKENGWNNSSITYGGYNGEYSSLGSKYKNDAHDNFISSNNPLEELMSKYSLSLSSNYPNQKKDGTGSVSFGKNEGNKEHIKTGLDVVDTTPNSEYDTGKSWLQYNRVMFYQRNSDRGEISGTQGKFNMTGAGVFRNDNVPYFDEAPKVNDIVIHNPVSTQDSVVITNDQIYDKRTNAKLLQGGDPIGLKGGVCPVVGCEFSDLICTEQLTPHTSKCYIDAPGFTNHVGGFNSHVHTSTCRHTHNSSCYSSGGSSGSRRYVCDGAGCMTSYGHDSSLCSYGHSCNGCNTCHTCENEGKYEEVLICGKTEQSCNNIPNTHTCTSACKTTTNKVLSCNDPHHYKPGEPTDSKNHKFHHPIGDPRCWKRCGDDKKHGEPDNIELPTGGSAKMGGVFINLDREFKIYYPFIGDFAENPGMEGIAETTQVRGKGYYNRMNTEEWTSHRWVRFPVNVIDPKGDMRLAYSQIDLNDFSTTDEEFTFYSVLANDEVSKGSTKFTSTAINLPGVSHDVYFDESDGVTNKNRPDWKYGARHTGHKYQDIDVVGYIGSMTLHDTGDFRFSNLFKQKKGDGTWLIPNLVPEVHLNRPNYIVSDNVTSRLDKMDKNTHWLNTYGNLYNQEGGKSGGTDRTKEPLLLPLVPRYNNIAPLRNQPMRPGYQLYMDTETVGNYYGETLDEDTSKFIDSQMQQKMQVLPKYYSLDLNNGQYTPVDVYYGINGEYMQVNDYDFGNITEDSPGVKDYYYYLDWLEESARRNNTDLERGSTEDAKVYRADKGYGDPNFRLRSPNAQKDVIGSANVLFLNDLNRTFIGSSKTYGSDKNPGKKLDERYYNQQSQRWHYTIGLPSSSVFVESNKPCTETNIKALQSKDRVIVCTLDIKVLGTVWTLEYDGTSVNSNGFKVFEGGKTYRPPTFDENGKFTTDPEKDVTSKNPIIVVYPSNKTSKDDIDIKGIQ